MSMPSLNLAAGFCRITSPAWVVFVFTSFAASAQTGPGGVSSGTTNLLLWLDGQNVNADGTSPANGSEVVTWYDRSGNGVNVTRNIAGVATKSANGVTFNNIGYLNGSDATFPTGSAARTVIVCASSPSTATDDVFFFYGTATNNQSYGVLKIGTSNAVRNYFYNNDLDVAGGWTPSGTLKIITCTYTPTTQNLHVNNDATPNTRTASSVNTTLGSQGLQVGGWNSFNLFSQATIAEIIFYDKVLSAAERIIVNNALAAKYGLTLADNDHYTMDNALSGNYDHEVAGIGRAGGVSHTNARGPGIIRVFGPTNMGNNGEYFFWGHDNGPLVAQTTDVPAGVEGRFTRVWRGQEVGSISNFDMEFDLTGLEPATAGDLRLLIDTDDDGMFSDETAAGGGVVGGATDQGGSIFRFTNVTGLLPDLNSTRRFTLGTTNIIQTPLPIVLLSFDASVESDNTVFLEWSTAQEINNDYFTIERSADGENWEEIFTTSGSGNSAVVRGYSWTDDKPLWGRSYYRLRQTDFDGTTSYSRIAAVTVNKSFHDIAVYPIPAKNEIYVDYPHSENITFRLSDRFGRDMGSVPNVDNHVARFDISALRPGLYILHISNGHDVAYRKIIVE